MLEIVDDFDGNTFRAVYTIRFAKAVYLFIGIPSYTRANYGRLCQFMPFYPQLEVSMATMNVSLPDPMREWVEGQVKSGEYANVSDYIRDLIRHDQRRHQSLEEAVREGLASGRSSRKAEDIMRVAKARLQNG